MCIRTNVTIPINKLFNDSILELDDDLKAWANVQKPIPVLKNILKLHLILIKL